MKRFWMGVAATLSIGAAAGAVVVYAGLLNVSADTPHSQFVYRMIETARERAIDRHTQGLAAPTNLSDPDRIRRGAGNYAAMCVNCHLAPGKADSEIRMGLYPQPPDLARPAESADDEAARQFWVIKHGIKASGMPAWSRGGVEDEAIWDMVAFLQRMPALTPEQYRALVESSEGHSHGGLAIHEERRDQTGEAGHAPTKSGGHDHADGHAH